MLLLRLPGTRRDRDAAADRGQPSARWPIQRALLWVGLLSASVVGWYAFRRYRRIDEVESATCRRARLLRQFDDVTVLGSTVLSCHFEPSAVQDIIDATRRRYEDLVPALPDIGGRRNPLSENLEYSAIFLALYRTLKERGESVETIGQIFYELMEAWYQRYPAALLRLLGRLRFTRLHYRSVQEQASRSQERRYPADFVYTFVPGDGTTFDFGVDYTECAILKFFRAQGAEKIMPHICALDGPHSEVMGFGLLRGPTLAEGAPRCQFRMKRGGPTRVRIPWKEPTMGVNPASMADATVNAIP